MNFTALHCLTNFTFLTGASHPHELVEQAHANGYSALAITDECSLAGVVKAHVAAKALDFHLIIGSHFKLSNGLQLVALAPSRQAYSELSGFISLARRRSEKGQYEAHLEDLRFRLQHCLIIWQVQSSTVLQEDAYQDFAAELVSAFKQRLWLGISHLYGEHEQTDFFDWQALGNKHGIPLVASPKILMHEAQRKPLQDTLTAIRHNTAVQKLGKQLEANAEAYLKSLPELSSLYAEALLEQTDIIRQQCHFHLDEIRYQYPRELVPKDVTPIEHLTALVNQGKQDRWPEGVPEFAQRIIDKELALIEELEYEYYFLTVEDIVRFARRQNILCQGRGSAANSVVCYCLHITEIAPGQINVLFERFISKERDEPPDIDVDFEHQRREEVIQYIYEKYSRQRAALAATVITYRSRSAIRDVGKALNLEPALIDHLAKSLAWWDRTGDLYQRIEEMGIESNKKTMQLFFALVHQILGYPRHLSQHVGGFIITQDKVSDLVPVENASMPDRTIIQWDKEDLEAMGLLKIDVLALGMLTALRKSLEYVNRYDQKVRHISDIPHEDPQTYAMLSRGDSVGVFQVESRAQMSMLPRLKPKTFYDLVIEIAIVRPGPIQGDMVHPYLRRRDGLEPITYQNEAIQAVLEPTLGVPIFQEQAIRLAMVAAGFSGGEADHLRRAMASWGKNGNLLQFEEKFLEGMNTNGYDSDYALRLFEQIKGFGGYGFPESHSASFALLCYSSSWLKCHHPAAFYCALLNSQPMGFYSPSQLIQDAQRHHIRVLPVEINSSEYDNQVLLNQEEVVPQQIRLGFCMVKGLDTEKAKAIARERGEHPFKDIQDLYQRSSLHEADIQRLASADALHALAGHRYQARWQAAAVEEPKPLFQISSHQAELTTRAPNLESEIVNDLQATQVSLRTHPMALLRLESPFNRCKKYCELEFIGNGRFVQVAGLVTGRQRPGTAKGTIFVTLEDETGNINVIVWSRTQEQFRQVLLTSKLLLVKGRLETKDSVVHVVAGQLIDYSNRIEEFRLNSRDFH